MQYVGEYTARHHGRNYNERAIPWDALKLSADELMLVDWQINRLSEPVTAELLGERLIIDLQAIPGDFLKIRWASQESSSEKAMIKIGGKRFYLATLDDDSIIGFALHQTPRQVWYSGVLNRRSPIVDWACKLASAARDPARSISSSQVDPLGSLLATPCTINGHEHQKLRDYMKAWRTSAVEADLLPPDVDIGKQQFHPPSLRPKLGQE